MNARTPSESCVPDLANLPLVGWFAAGMLGGLFHYLDHHAPYREILGYPKDTIEDYCLWLAVVIASLVIVQGCIVWILIWRSAGRLRGTYRVAIGIALNLLALPIILLVLFARALITPH